MKFATKLSLGCIALLSCALGAAGLLLTGQSFSGSLTSTRTALQAQQDAAGTADSADDDAASQRVAEAQAAYDAAAAELAALQPAEEPDGNTEPAADSAEEPQSEPDSANGENAG